MTTNSHDATGSNGCQGFEQESMFPAEMDGSADAAPGGGGGRACFKDADCVAMLDVDTRAADPQVLVPLGYVDDNGLANWMRLRFVLQCAVRGGAAMWLWFANAAFALTLALRAEETPYPGITLSAYRTSSPDTDTWVVRVDLCEAGVHVESTTAPDVLQTAGGWGADVGVQVALNGDFYRTGPVRVYGDAIGDG
ncbi:MAG: hypothetical protein VKI39_07735, partial [Synechococcus sp.]|nr:hypothetical protein [Synechococcus sp.]